MIPDSDTEVVHWPTERRSELRTVLEESFSGWYLRHALGKLKECETVLVVLERKQPIGLVLLETLHEGTGYVFYIAVVPSSRKKGIGGLLLDHALEHFVSSGFKRVYAATESENESALRLFYSKGFVRTNFVQVSKLYGFAHALELYRRMVVVPGEVLLVRELPATHASPS